MKLQYDFFLFVFFLWGLIFLRAVGKDLGNYLGM